MKETIIQKLNEIECENKIRILHAVESGSRAWGFPSPDSDYDVRFFYVRPRNDYLRLDKRRDVLEYPLGDKLDINGWDLDKTLRLLHASNPTLFEWSASPIVYHTTAFFRDLLPTIRSYFVTRSGLWHYLSMAEGNYREYLKGEQVRAKKYFYVIRPLLACRWILERGTPPPMPFAELVATQLDASVRPYVDELLQIKAQTAEIGEIPRIQPLNNYIEESLSAIRSRIEALPKAAEREWEPLNSVFLSALAKWEAIDGDIGESSRVFLREWKTGDATDLAAAINNKNVLDNLRDGIPYPYTEKDAAEFIAATLSAEKDSQYAFAICYGDKAIGSIGVFRKDSVHRLTAEMGYYIAEPYWGMGIMTEAVRQMCAYIFQNTDIVRIFAEPYAHNDASCRVLAKAGFRFEGVLRQNAVKKGNSVDMKMYAIIRDGSEIREPEE